MKEREAKYISILHCRHVWCHLQRTQDTKIDFKMTNQTMNKDHIKTFGVY